MLIESNRNNRYLIARGIPRVLLLHPLLGFVIELHQRGIEPGRWLEEWPGTPIRAGGREINASRQEMEHFVRHFEFLQEHGYIDAPTRPGVEENRRYTAGMIEATFANTRELLFEVVAGCNLSCRYCGFGEFYHQDDPRDHAKLPFAVGRQVIDRFLALWEKHRKPDSPPKRVVLSFYGGEPLLNFPFIEETVSHVRSRAPAGIDFAFSLTTNGLLLPKYQDFLIENRFYLGISLDGDRRHNRLRVFPDGRESFAPVKEAILNLKRRDPRFFRRQVTIYSVYMHDPDVRSMVRFGRDQFHITPQMLSVARNNLIPETELELDRLFADLSAAGENTPVGKRGADAKSAAFFRKFSGHYFPKFSKLLAPARPAAEVKTRACHPFERRIYVTAHGKVRVCHMIRGVYEMGRATPEGLDLDFQAIADRYREWLQMFGRVCNRCCQPQPCPKCVFQLDVEGGEPRCPFFVGWEELAANAAAAISSLELDHGILDRKMPPATWVEERA